MVQEITTTEHVKEPKVFIPLAPDDIVNVDVWGKRWPLSKKREEMLAVECESAIKTAFDTLGLLYDTKVFGDVKMVNLQYTSERGGISFSEKFFAFIPAGVRKI